MTALRARRTVHGLLAAAMAVLASGCNTLPGGLSIDPSVQAQSQSSRVETVVLHYTSTTNQASLEILSEHNVSSHYLITDEPRPHVYQLVDESRRAWHAGISQWYGRTYLNSSSIGIEIVNPGRRHGDWADYPPAQIRTLIALLKDIVRRHQIKPHNIVGHSDIAPQRKVDPGPRFPWKALANAGIGRWYDATEADASRRQFEQSGLPDIGWVQNALQRAGYEVPLSGRLDGATRNVIAAFQMHYRPTRYDGLPDAETLGILSALP